MSTVYIHAPVPTRKELSKTTCPDCNKKTYMICFLTPWYGWDSTCIKCGRSWSDGEWQTLDFVRQSRQKSIAYAKKRWRAMPPKHKNNYEIYST